MIYGEKNRGSAYVLYLFSRIGKGSWPVAAGFAVVTAVLSVLVMAALSRSFLRIATAGERTGRVRYTERPLRQRSAFGALPAREFARFGGNENYMLNCGLGILLIPAFGGLLLAKGREICEVLDGVQSVRPGSAAVLMVSAFCLIPSMNDMAAPGVAGQAGASFDPDPYPGAVFRRIRRRCGSGVRGGEADVRCGAYSFPKSLVSLSLYASAGTDRFTFNRTERGGEDGSCLDERLFPLRR